MVSVRPLYASHLGRIFTLLFVLLAALVATPSAQTAKSKGKPTPPPPPPALAKGRLLAIADFHGALEPPTGSSGLVSNGSAFVVAGGAAYLATHLEQLRAEAAANGEQVLLVGAGDMVGESPFLSAATHDEATIDLLSRLGLEFTAAGEGEFAEGVNELKRLQYGGCHPVDGCVDADGFAGAAFRYLVANVVDKRTKLPVLLPVDIRFIQGVPVGFVGVTMRDTPAEVSSSGIAKVEFLDEAQTANLYAVLARLVGIKSLVLMVHQGGRQSNVAMANPNACEGLSGPIVDIVSRLRPEYGVVITGHTHSAYVCTLPNASGQNSLVTSATANGTMITSIGVTLDKQSKQFTAISAENVIVTRSVTPDPEIVQFIADYKVIVAPIGARPVGSIAATLSRVAAPSGETTLGAVVADAQLAFTTSANAQIAFVNPGGLRADLNYPASGSEPDGVVTYQEVFTVQPFNFGLTTMTLTGAQLKTVLEQQFAGFNGQIVQRILQVSNGFSYSYSRTRALGDRISDMKVNGTPVDPAATYRVAVNSFLANGGDGFSTFTQGTDRTNAAGFDIDALVNYLGANPALAPPPLNRIQVVE